MTSLRLLVAAFVVHGAAGLHHTGVNQPSAKEVEDFECQCMNWAGAYVLNFAECGKGLEYSFISSAEDVKSPAEFLPLDPYVQGQLDAVYKPMLCPMLAKLNTPACLRTGRHNSPGKWYSDYWCYTGSKCFANGTYAVKGVNNSRVKMCSRTGPGKDQFLSDMPPEAIFRLGNYFGIDAMGHFLDVVYPVETRFEMQNMRNHTEDIEALRRLNKTIVIGGEDARYVISGSDEQWYVPFKGGVKMITHPTRWEGVSKQERLKLGLGPTEPLLFVENGRAGRVLDLSKDLAKKMRKI